MSGSVPPSRFAMTVNVPSGGTQDPSGRSSTARRCCSNWDVRAPSIVQCPLLCGRIASSLTSRPPSSVSNNSTASRPVTPSSAAIFSAIASASTATSGFSPGAGAITSRQMPSTCTGCTTGYAAPRPDGGPCHQRRKLTPEWHELLGHQRYAVREDVLDFRRGFTDPHALAVISAADRFEDNLSLARARLRLALVWPGAAHERLDVRDGGDRREPGARDSERAQPLAHGQLVLGVFKCTAARPDEDPVGLELGENTPRYVL